MPPPVTLSFGLRDGTEIESTALTPNPNSNPNPYPDPDPNQARR